MAHHLPALWPAVTVDHGQGHTGQEEGVAARSVAGNPASGYPFMDIGILGVFGPTPALRIALDGSNPVGVALPVVSGVVGVCFSVVVIFAPLGLLPLRRVAPFISA